MKRIAVFAHYDKNNIIENYVVYYLKELKKVADSIVFVSDCSLENDEIKKISDITSYNICKKHGEYDFGSYKKGFLYLRENDLLKDYDEVVFANDSCYAPIFPFKKVFDKMENSNCDFWGMNCNNIDVSYHIQSFFLVFRKKVFLSEAFNNFVDTITKKETKDKIIEDYEIGLSKLLMKLDFKSDCYIKEPIDRVLTYNVFKQNNPLIKTCAVDGAYNFFVNIAIKNTNYPKDLIFEAKRYKQTKKQFSKNFDILKKLIIRLHLNKKELYIFNKKINF